MNETEIDFPVLDIHHKDFDETLKYYGAKILKPGESFHMGYDKPLFGMEYDTSLPGYIQDYVMKSYGGGGLFLSIIRFHIFGFQILQKMKNQPIFVVYY